MAATNRDLAAEMRAGRFREDLYYRLCSDLIATPSLREQLSDAPHDLEELVRFIARRIVGTEEAKAVTSEVLEWIENHLGRDYAWPGNFRELEQCVRNILVRKEYRPAARASAASLDLRSPGGKPHRGRAPRGLLRARLRALRKFSRDRAETGARPAHGQEQDRSLPQALSREVGTLPRACSGRFRRQSPRSSVWGTLRARRASRAALAASS